MTDLIVSAVLTASLLLSQAEATPIAGSAGELIGPERVLASGTIDLSNRYPVESVNDGFKENILIAVDYLQALMNLSLQPGEVFAFHKNILPEFRKYKIITQESGFVAKDGYKYVAGLAGNGVCHLASLMNMVASDAGLEVTAPVNHDFAQIPGIDKQYGTSIKYIPNGGSVSERQNLYIKNNFVFPVVFKFVIKGNNLTFAISS